MTKLTNIFAVLATIAAPVEALAHSLAGPHAHPHIDPNVVGLVAAVLMLCAAGGLFLFGRK